MSSNFLKQTFNSHVFIMFFMGVASGLPIVLIGSTLQAWYTVSGIDLMTVGMLTLIGQPYLYKFLWAPLLDRFAPLPLGRRRAWIMLMQVGLVILLVVMAYLNPMTSPWLLASVALVTAFFSATQDAAIDAYRTDLLTQQERSVGVSLNTIGYRFAMLLAGAGALIMAAEMGWRATYLVMAAIMLVNVFITLASPKPYEFPKPANLTEALVKPWKEFLTRKNVIFILIFVLTYKLCDAIALSLNTVFLLRGIGFSLMDVGSIAKSVSLIAAILGSLLGGLLLPYLGLYRSLLYFGFLQMASNLLFALMAIVGKSYLLMVISMFSDYFCGALSTVAFTVFLMNLCDKHYTATQYALLSALTAVGRVFVGPEAAFMVNHLGWVQFYVWTFVLGLPALAILWWLNRRVDFSAEQLARV